MKLIVKIVVLVLASLVPALAQNTSDEPASLGDAARELKTENKTKSVAKFSDESESSRKPLIPDVAAIGRNNIDEILQGIDDYRASHNLQETEAAVRDWYNQQIALFRNAVAENRTVTQRQETRGSNPNDARPNNHDQFVNLRRTEESSRQDEQRQIKQNQRLMDRIQQDFITVRPEMEKRYKMNVDWFSICDGVVCSY